MTTGTAQGIGINTPRIDGRRKVTGQARYGADMPVSAPAYGFLRISAIARGRITAIDEKEARALNGVLEVFTYKNVGEHIKPGKFFSNQGYMGSSIAPLASDKVWHDGQIVALVIADSFETARDAAHRLTITYDEDKPSAGFDSPGATTVAAADVSKKHRDPAVGDEDTAFAASPVKIIARYSTPTQHHNPIELFSTTCAWNADRLTVWESSQNVYGFRFGIADQLGIDPGNVRVISPFIGGAFGSRGSLSHRTALVAFAARQLNRPVKLVATRDQGFTTATYRAETRHQIRIGAQRDGSLVSLSHEGWEVTSRPDPYMVAGTDASTRLYECHHIASKVSIVHADRSTPGFMRSPPELPYLFALESAMDELALALNMDPVELRRVNDTKNEPINGLPYTTRSLMACFDAAAAEFDWVKRRHHHRRPGSITEGDWLIGLGCAAAMYPTAMGPAAARVTLLPDASVKVQTAAHDIGTGAYTAIALTAADRLGVPVERISVEIGDSDLPPAPIAGGSNTTASVCNAVAKACAQIRSRIAGAAAKDKQGRFAGRNPASLSLARETLRDRTGHEEPLTQAIARASNGAIEAYAENIPHGVKPEAMGKLYRGMQTLAGGANMDDRAQFAFGAEFVEVRVHKLTREIRVPRIVGAFAAGRIVNPRTAESQLSGGMIWGISSALHEATEIDQRAARFVNADLADYLIPVNADIGSVKVIMLPEQDDQVNPLGIKGLGELANVGTNAAVCNALYHATGRRIRDLPIRLEKLL
jgi:xanthine dehydrogenase YagR molybdenum-binding subunit